MKRKISWALSVVLAAFFHTAVIAKVDDKSLPLINASLNAMGGIENYNNTRFISWVFFGRRFHIWDKYTGDVRIESQDGSLILMNVNNKQGRAWGPDKALIKDKKELAEKLKFGYEAWINDSYWLVMPYKMLDPGVNVTYTRQDKTANGKSAEVVTMTFTDVGVTPENKYEIFFDQATKRVSQWRYYAKSEDQTPAFELSWANWQHYGNIMLSDMRGERGIGPLNVYQALPELYFTQPEPVTTVPGAFIQVD